MPHYVVMEIEVVVGGKYHICEVFTDEASANAYAHEAATDTAMNLTADLGEECSVSEDVTDDKLQTVADRVGPAYGVMKNDSEEILTLLCVVKPF